MRIIIELSDRLIESLDRVSGTEHLPRAALIREAIAVFLQTKSGPAAEAAFGLLKDRKTGGLSYQDNLRAEWKSR